MNERIKLLAEQARQYYLTLPTGFNPENVGMYPQLMEKFAELIVKECAQSANDWYQNHDQLHWDPATHILAHFGVEE